MIITCSKQDGALANESQDLHTWNCLFFYTTLYYHQLAFQRFPAVSICNFISEGCYCYTLGYFNSTLVVQNNRCLKLNHVLEYKITPIRVIHDVTLKYRRNLPNRINNYMFTHENIVLSWIGVCLETVTLWKKDFVLFNQIIYFNIIYQNNINYIIMV